MSTYRFKCPRCGLGLNPRPGILEPRSCPRCAARGSGAVLEFIRADSSPVRGRRRSGAER